MAEEQTPHWPAVPADPLEFIQNASLWWLNWWWQLMAGLGRTWE